MRGCTAGRGDFEDWSCQIREAPDAATVADELATSGEADVSGVAVLLLLAVGFIIGGGLVIFVLLRKSNRPSRHKRCRNYRERNYNEEDTLGSEMQPTTIGDDRAYPDRDDRL